MAFRIHDSVVKGEIDNRINGRVTGKIWMEGRPDPVILDLEGNAHPDLAGCLLTFSNPHPRLLHPHLDSLHPVQRGTIGDLTASRKVRVFDLPVDEALAMLRRGEKPPEHMGNSLYLEWFSDYNGRVVIESGRYELTITTPEWVMSEQENQERARDAESGMAQFMDKLTAAVEEQQRGQKDPEEPWDEHDYERFLKESDARTEKYGELLDKYGHSEEAQEKIAREMGWDKEKTGTNADDEAWSVEEMNAICEEAKNEPLPEPDADREGIDWIRTKDGEIRHPLQHRCFESAIRFHHEIEGNGLKESGNDELEKLRFEFIRTAVKLGGVLTGIAEGRDFRDDAMTVAWLKRALDCLHQAQAALATVSSGKLLPEPLAERTRQELFEIREGILRLMDEFRGRR